MKTCPVCGKGKLERKTQPQRFPYQGKSLRYKQPGWWCPVRREGVLETGDMEETERVHATVDQTSTTTADRWTVRLLIRLGGTLSRAHSAVARHGDRRRLLHRRAAAVRIQHLVDRRDASRQSDSPRR